MSHPEQIGFFEVIAEVNNTLIDGAKVLEIGSYDVNGGIRHLFAGAERYVGVDLDAGPGVDVVGFGHQIDDPNGTYDITISGECFEHDQHWRDTFLNMARMTRPGGLVAFTCAARGRAEHGTKRSGQASSPGTTAVGLDYYRNLNEEDFADLGLDQIFSDYRFWYLDSHFDLFFAGVKAGGEDDARRATIPDDAAIDDLRGLMTGVYKALMVPFRALSKVLPEERYQTVSLPLWNAVMPAVIRFDRHRAALQAGESTASKLTTLAKTASVAPTAAPPFLKRRHPFRRAAMMAALGPDLAVPTTARASNTPPGAGPVVEAFEEARNIHKLRHYLPVYETVLPQDRPIRMLEIGVARGGSLQMWRGHLHPDSVIVGIDIAPETKRFEDSDALVHVRIGSQADYVFLQSVIDEFGPFDVILDDGSHMASHMIESFRYLFPHGLAPGGAYVVEDVCANYWPTYRDQPMSFVDFTRHLIDAMHAHYLPMAGEVSIREGHPKRVRAVQVPLAAVLLQKIEFYDSIAVIHRAPKEKSLPRSVYR